MQNQEIIKSVECAVPHKCAKNEKDLTKKCAQCEIGYSFVACEPRALECGHLVCLECKSKVQKGSLKCKICGVYAKYTEVQGISALTLFQVFLNDFTKQLRDKYKAALYLYDERKITIEKKVNELRFKLKNEIDLKVESLKAELDSLRDELIRDVNHECDKAIENSIGIELKNEKKNFKNDLIELESCVEKCKIETEKFFSYQKSLKNMLERIQNGFNFDLQIKFKPSDSHFRSAKDLIGEVEDGTIIKPPTQIKQTTSDSSYNSATSDSKPIIQPTEQKRRLKLSGHKNHVCALAILSNGDLASGSEDKTIKTWNCTNGVLKQTINVESEVLSLLVLENGNLISGLADGQLKLFSNDLRLLKTTTCHANKVYSLILLKNDFFASASADKTIKIWFKDCVLKTTLQGHTGSVTKLAVLSNGYIASSEDRIIAIWNSNGSLNYSWLAHDKKIWALACLSNGDLVSGSDDFCIKIWNSVNFQLLKNFSIYSEIVSFIKVLSSGDLAIGYYDGDIVIADRNGTVKNKLSKHKSSVRDIVVLKNGELASASADRSVNIWAAF